MPIRITDEFHGVRGRSNMTITAYQVDSVLSAYSKQSKIRTRQPSDTEETKSARYQDVVSLSQQGNDKAEAYKKISYSIIDIILKDRGV